MYEFTKSQELFIRSAQVIPNGIYGHQTPLRAGARSVSVLLRARRGRHVWDVDGNEYIDYMCSYGPDRPRAIAIRRWRRRRWRRCARATASTGRRRCGPSWPSTSSASRRSPTGRCSRRTAPTSAPGPSKWRASTPGGRRSSWRRARITARTPGARRCPRAPRRRTAPTSSPSSTTISPTCSASSPSTSRRSPAIIVTPFRHDALSRLRSCRSRAFTKGVRQLCDDKGIVFVLDDVRCGFRLHLGGSGEYFGVRPDLSAYCKAIANGYPLSACVGRDALRGAAERVFFTGSYFTSGVPMAAALACLQELQASGGIEHMRHVGTMLCRGLEEQARSHGLAITVSGPPAIPFMSFKDDPRLRTQQGVRRRVRGARRVRASAPQLVPLGGAQRDRHPPHAGRHRRGLQGSEAAVRVSRVATALKAALDGRARVAALPTGPASC